MFETYEAPAFEDGDEYKPKDHYDRLIIVKVRERKEGIITDNTPDPGGPGVICDLVDVAEPAVYRNVLWMGGAIVDGLTRYAGRGPIVITFVQRKSKNGRTYPVPEPATAEQIAQAQAWITANGDPFLPVLGTTEPAPAPAPAATGGSGIPF